MKKTTFSKLHVYVQSYLFAGPTISQMSRDRMFSSLHDMDLKNLLLNRRKRRPYFFKVWTCFYYKQCRLKISSKTFSTDRFIDDCTEDWNDSVHRTKLGDVMHFLCYQPFVNLFILESVYEITSCSRRFCPPPKTAIAID